MMYYEQLAGVTLPGLSSNPTYAPAPEDTLANIPGWKAYFDPSYPSGSGLLNRAQPASFITPTTPFDLTATINSHPALKMAPAASNPTFGTFDYNPTAYTVFVVLTATTVSPTGGRPILRPADSTNSNYGLELVIRTNGNLAVYNNDTSILRVQSSSSVTDGTPQIYMVTFSTDATLGGLRMYKKGNVLDASNLSDKQPLTDQYLSGQHRVFYSNSGTGILNYGVLGVLDIDLSWPANADYRSMIFNYFQSYYNIT